MLKPPASPIPGMTDTLEFVKNLWGNMNIPGAMPGMGGGAISTDDLDKKIADLKAVEAWLNMNVSMLRGTIQALEVQRNTIATLKAMGESMAHAMGQPGADKANPAAPFAAFFSQAAAKPGAATPAPTPAPAAPGGAAASAAAGATTGAPGAAATPGAAALPAAVAWWNLLQDQFKQAVSNAMSPDAMAGAAAMAQDAAKRFAEAASVPAKPATPAAADSRRGASAEPRATKPRTPRARADKR